MEAGLVAGIGGLLGGILGGGGKEGGQMGQNFYTPNLADPRSNYDIGGIQNHIGQAMANQPTYEKATQQAMSNPMLSQLFGQGGLMGQTGQSIQDLMKSGYQLTPEDRTAYGQASGDIARQFGQTEQSLAQSLANRGMSNSGAAGAAFSGLQGNKNEQLANLQRQIADNRMNMNLKRLGEMHNFMTSLGQQAQGAMGQAFNQDLEGNQQLYNMNKGMLDSMQGQENKGFEQAHNTQQGSQTGGILGGALSGITGGISAYNEAKKAGIF